LFPQGQKKKKKKKKKKEGRGGGRGMKMQLMPHVNIVQVCSVKTRTVSNGFDAKGV